MKAKELRIEMEDWLRQSGIEKVVGKRFELSDPPEALVDQAAREECIITVQPAGCTAPQLSELFNLTNWAAAGLDTVSAAPVEKDHWFAAPASEIAPYLGQSPESVAKAADGKKGMSLEQYLMFAARFKASRGHFPDVNSWTWLPESHERTLPLFAGFDSFGNLQINSCTPDYADDNTGCRLITLGGR
jgi:hypothetical protein